MHAQGQWAHAQMYTGQHGHTDTPRGQADTDTHRGTLAGTQAEGRGASSAVVGTADPRGHAPGGAGLHGRQGALRSHARIGRRDPRE